MMRWFGDNQDLDDDGDGIPDVDDFDHPDNRASGLADLDDGIIDSQDPTKTVMVSSMKMMILSGIPSNGMMKMKMASVIIWTR